METIGELLGPEFEEPPEGFDVDVSEFGPEPIENDEEEQLIPKPIEEVDPPEPNRICGSSSRVCEATCIVMQLYVIQKKNNNNNDDKK